MTTTIESPDRELPAALRIHTGRRVAVLSVAGGVGAGDVAALEVAGRECLRRVAPTGAGRVVVDLRATTRLAPAAFAAVAACGWDVRTTLGRPLALVVDPANPAVNLAHLTGLGEILALYDSLVEACHPDAVPEVFVPEAHGVNSRK